MDLLLTLQSCAVERNVAAIATIKLVTKSRGHKRRNCRLLHNTARVWL
jgi:hypothetical protein